jgi:uncharacterized protein YacL
MTSGSLSTTVLRTSFAIVFAVTGFLLGREVYINVLSLHFASDWLQWAMEWGTPVVGALLGVVVERLAPAEIAGGAVGLLVGLGTALLVKSILFEFISITGRAGSYFAILLYLIVAIFFAYLGARVGAKTRLVPIPKGMGVRGSNPKVVDTSVIVDGRIVEIVQSGFIEGPLIVPRFVLRELQAIADSEDPQRRTRGRRGLEALTKLQELRAIEINERDYDDLPLGSVDSKLVRLARELQARLLTNDYNLNRVAQVEGVEVLNINELANAVKPVVLPGEELHVHVIREGKEAHQGVAYLDDGTMIVIEQGRRLVGSSTDVVVTSVLQTVAGRMIFARPKAASAAVR